MTGTGNRIHDLAVVGAGPAGLAAALFAARRGLLVVLYGPTGNMSLNTGLVDVLGVGPATGNGWLADPWTGVRQIITAGLNHPYALLGEQGIRRALDTFLAECGLAGLPYRHTKANSFIATALGTIKPTWAAPQSMWSGVEALEQRLPSLIIGFHGLREFSARQFTANLAAEWPGLSHGRVAFPGAGTGPHWVTGELAALTLDSPRAREELAGSIEPLLGSSRAVGLPAVLGLGRHAEAMENLSARLGRPVFEIPGMPPSVPGLRLGSALEDRLRSLGGERVRQRVSGISLTDSDLFRLEIQGPEHTRTDLARGVILAGGRFIGGGLSADCDTIREPLCGLPVAQPDNRSGWHRQTFLHPLGHGINSSGLVCDRQFRPVDDQCGTIHSRLHAAGSILAGVDWMRNKCGTGAAIASALGSVDSFARSLGAARGDDGPVERSTAIRPLTTAPARGFLGGSGKNGFFGILQREELR